MSKVDDSLYFVSAIDNSQLRRDVLAIQEQLKGITSTASQEAKKFDNVYKNLATAVAGYFSIQALGGFGQQLIQVRGEFQQLGIALETILGSKEKADRLMAQVVDLAAKTPFTLSQVGAGAKQLLAFQVAQDEVIDTLTRLGNVASGVGVPIDRLILLYGKAKNKGRLMGDDMNQFMEAGVSIHEFAKVLGVADDKVSQLVESGKVGFTDVQKVMKNLTDEGGMFFNLMEKQSKSLTGMVSNLEDAWSRMLNEIGKSNEGILAGGITGLTDLVNNYDKVIDVIKVLTITYGAYKAATIVSSIATNGLTIAENLHYATLLIAEKAQKLLNATSLANPYVAVATALMGIISALVIFGNKTNELSEKSKMLADVTGSVATQLEHETSVLGVYRQRILDTNPGTTERVRLVKELNEKYPDLLKNLNAENATLGELSKAFDSYTDSLEKTIRLKVLESKLSDILTEKQSLETQVKEGTIDSNEKYNKSLKLDKQREALLEELQYQKDLVDYGQKTADLLLEKRKIEIELSNIPDLARKIQEKPLTIDEFTKDYKALASAATSAGKPFKSSLEDINKAYDEYVKQFGETNIDYDSKVKRLADIKKLLANPNTTITTSTIRNVPAIDADIKSLQDLQLKLSDTSEKWKEYERKILLLQKERDSITGNKKEDSKTKKDEQKDAEEYQKYLDDLFEKTTSYEEKKRALKEKYTIDRQDLKSMGKTSNVAELDKQYKTESDALEAENFKKMESYRWVYDQIEIMGVKSLQNYINRLKIEIASFTGNAEVKLELTKKLAEAENAISTKSPTIAISNLNKDLSRLKLDIKNAKTKADRETLKAELALKQSQKANLIGEQFNNASIILGSMSELAGQFDASLGKALQTAGELAGGVGNVITAFSGGSAVSKITSVIGLISTLVKAFKKPEEDPMSVQIQSWIEHMQKLLSLQQAYLELLGSKDQIKEYADLIGMVSAQMDLFVAKSQKVLDGNLQFYKRFNKDFAATLAALPKSVEEWSNDDWLAAISTASGDAKKSLEEMYAQWLELQKAQKDYINTQNELLTGSTYDSIVSSIVDGFADGVLSAEEFAKTFEDLMKQSIINAMKIKMLEGPLKAWQDQFAAYWKDGVLSPEEIAALKAQMKIIVDNGQAELDALDQTGIFSANVESDSNTLSGAIQGMSQDSADLMAGQLGAMRIHLADIAAAITGNFNSDLKAAFNTDELTSTFGLGLSTMNSTMQSMRDAALKANDHLFQIEVNTRELASIKTLLADNLKTRGYDTSFTDRRAGGR